MSLSKSGYFGEHAFWEHALWEHVLWEHALWEHALWEHALWEHPHWENIQLGEHPCGKGTSPWEGNIPVGREHPHGEQNLSN